MPPELELYVPRSMAAAEQRALRPDIVERRDPTAATKQLQYTSPGLAQVPEWDADKAFRFGYIANVIAYRCIQLRARAVSNVPLIVGPRRGVPRTDPENSPLWKLLGPPPGGPAPKLSARKLLRWTLAQQIVTGRRAWEIETANQREDGLPVAFWPLVSAKLDAEPTDGGTEWFRVFKYGRSDDKRTLRPGFVFYGWDPAGLDFRQAESALQSARFDFSMVTLADRYSISFLTNNATPATVVTTSTFPDDDTRTRFRSQWIAEYGGVDNAGRTNFHEVGDDGDGPVGESIDIKVLGLSQKDAQLAESRKTSLMEVAISLGTPWSKLDASGRTFDNAEAEERTWWRDTNDPDMTDLEDDINMQLAPRLGSDVCWFDRDSVPELRRKVVPITNKVGVDVLTKSQLMTINEARADYGLAPIDGGDRMMTAEEIQALTATVGDGLVRDVLTRMEERQAPELAEPAPLLELPPAPVEDRAPSAEEVEARRAQIWRTADAVVRTLEGRWVRSMSRLFTRQERSTLARLTGKRGRQALGYTADGIPETRAPGDPAPQVDPSAIFDPAHWTDETREVTVDLYEQTTTSGLERLSASFGVDFDLEAPWVAEFVEARTNQLAGPVTQTTYEAIRVQLQEGVAAGEAIDDLAKRIRAVFADASTRRSVVIARTETISAYNGAAVAGATALPADVVGGQEWIATRDGRTRPAHASADGQIVGVGQAFDVGGDALAYPGDPAGRGKNTVQCRCTVAFLTPAEMEAALAGRGGAPRTVRTTRAAALIDLLSTDIDLLAWRRALTQEAA